jgi:hypothetical protein
VNCSCFCVANLDLLPKFNLNASFDMSVCFQAALALSAHIQAGLPGLGGPASGSPNFGLSLSALAQLSAMAQLSAQVQAHLGFDLGTPGGISALAQLAASLSARISAIANLNLNMGPWVQLAQMNSLALQLSAVFNAALGVSASASLSLSMPPLSFGGAGLSALSALAALSASLGVKLDASFVASLQAMAGSLAAALGNISLNVSASLAAGFSAVAQLGASLGGINPLALGFPAVQLLVQANCSAMMSLAAQLGIDLSLGIPPLLPSLGAIPGLGAALTASLNAQLQAGLSAAASLGLALPSIPSLGLPSFNMNLSLPALSAASLTISLSNALGVDIARCWCEVCDLPDVVAAANAPSDDPAPDVATPASPVSSTCFVGTTKALETVMTAQLRCSMGIANSELVVTPINRTLINDHYAANIMDFVPLTNIMPFGMCVCPANPTVIAATAAALGVPTPMPCIPATSSPWQAGSMNVLLNEPRWLDNTSTCTCDWGGEIAIVDPGQHGTFIP